MKTSFRAIIFDLDGTLIDTLQDLADSMNQSLQVMGFPARKQEQYRIFVGDGVRNLVMRSLPMEHPSEELVDKGLGHMKEFYELNWNKQSKLYPEIPELLDELTRLNLPMAVLSNKIHAFTLKMVQFYLKKWNFKAVFGAQPGLPLKPDPTQALAIAQMIAIQPKEILYLGDTNTDIKTALSAKMIPVGAEWGFRNAKELLDSGANTILPHPLYLFEVFQGNHNHSRTRSVPPLKKGG